MKGLVPLYINRDGKPMEFTKRELINEIENEFKSESPLNQDIEVTQINMFKNYRGGTRDFKKFSTTQIDDDGNRLVDFGLISGPLVFKNHT